MMMLFIIGFGLFIIGIRLLIHNPVHMPPYLSVEQLLVRKLKDALLSLVILTRKNNVEAQLGLDALWRQCVMSHIHEELFGVHSEEDVIRLFQEFVSGYVALPERAQPKTGKAQTRDVATQTITSFLPYTRRSADHPPR